MKAVVKIIVKYIIIAIVGVILFITVNRAANAERPAASIGGEAFFLILPIMWWVLERTVKDLFGEYKRILHEIKSERSSKPQEHKQATKMINARNVVVFDNEGIPSFMVRFDKCTNADLFEGGSNQTHPAFIIDGKEVDRIYIAKYPCTLINGKPYSLPFTKPATDIDFDDAARACFSKGKGWHLLTAAEYALLALESEKNGTPPHCNTHFGAKHNNPEEKDVRCDGGYKIATGSGPPTLAHNHTPYGVYLYGNLREWVNGLRLMDGHIEVIENNNAANPVDVGAASHLWKPVLCGGEPTRFIVDGEGVRLTAADENCTDWKGCAWEDLQLEIESSELLKALALCPESEVNKESSLYVDTNGERLPIRSGGWSNGSSAFELDLYYPRSYVCGNVGFRAAFYE